MIPLLHIFGALFSLSALVCVIWKFKFIAALGQMGSIQERNMPWANLTKKREGGEKGKKLSADEQSLVDGEEMTKRIEKSLQTHDKLIYTLGVMNFGFSAYLLGAAPDKYWMWHVPKSILYIGHRWFDFKKSKQHYYLFDFCYWVNALSLVYIFAFPKSEMLFGMLFVAANGPLAWSVLAFSNSMIFHSAPHLTSVFIHTSPMLFTYGIRWYPSEFGICENFPSCGGGSSSASEDTTTTNATEAFSFSAAIERVWNANIYFYIWWAVLYYIWIYILRASRIKERGYETLFDYIITGTPLKALAKLTPSVTMQRIIYLCIHVCFGSLTMLLASMFHFYSWVAHLVFCFTIIGASSWNASGYYFTVFVRRYEAKLHQRAETKLAAK